MMAESGQQETSVRTPVWISRENRAMLIELLNTVIVDPRTSAADAEALDTAVGEIGVAEARDHLWPETLMNQRAVKGYPKDWIPVWFSDEERRALSAIMSMPAALKGLFV